MNAIIYRRQGGGGLGGGQDGQNESNEIASVTASAAQEVLTTSITSSSSSMSPPASWNTTSASNLTPVLTASSSSSSSPPSKYAITLSALGAFIALLILALLALWLLHRRKKNKLAKKTNSARPLPSPEISKIFSGVMVTNRSSAYGPSSPSMGRSSTDLFFPNQARLSRGTMSLVGRTGAWIDAHSGAQLSTPSSLHPTSSLQDHEAPFASPQSARYRDSIAIPSQATGITAMPDSSTYASAATLLPTTATLTAPYSSPYLFSDLPLQSPTYIEEITSPTSQRTLAHLSKSSVDTMGFPASPGFPSPGIEGFAPLLPPEPLRIVKHTEMERAVTSPEPGLSSPTFSWYNTDRESGVLGEESVVIQGPRPTYEKSWTSVARNMSQRTMNTMSTLGYAPITDEDLERLGVGLNPRYGR